MCSRPPVLVFFPLHYCSNAFPFANRADSTGAGAAEVVTIVWATTVAPNLRARSIELRPAFVHVRGVFIHTLFKSLASACERVAAMRFG